VSADGLVYDTGALVAAEKDDRLLWSLHRAALGRQITPIVPAGVLGEAWRGGPQHRLSRLLKGCDIEALTEDQARAVGVLAARSHLSDTVDLAVAESALRRNHAVITSNRKDIERVANAAGRRLMIHDA
jgi:predicted nucleic acid-binding protein